MTFTGLIKIRGINPYILVSKARASTLKRSWKRPMPVLVRINAGPRKAWRLNLMPVGDGSYYLYLHGAIRKASRSEVGDRVDVELRFDLSYRNGPQHPMPTWFRSRLAKNKAAKKSWDALIPSRQKEILRYFAGLKSKAAQARNLERAIRVLAGGEERFMGRAWRGGV